MGVGVGHSGPIQKLKICPGIKYIVSVSADGAILIWTIPEEMLCSSHEQGQVRM